MERDNVEKATQRKKLVEAVQKAEPPKHDGAWTILGERVRKVLVMLFDAEKDPVRPCALARVFKPDANTIADVADYAENPDNKHKIACIKGLRSYHYFLHAMAVCDCTMRPLKCDPHLGTLSFHRHIAVAIDTALLADFHAGKLKELDPATPNN